jgi:transposase-like protein
MTDTRKIAAEYRLSHWAQIIRRQKESGRSIKEFCETAGFHQNSFFYWQRKLRDAVRGELLPTRQAAPDGWAIARAVGARDADDKQTSQKLPIEIGHYRVLVGMDTDSELLVKVCKVLVALC